MQGVDREDIRWTGGRVRLRIAVDRIMPWVLLGAFVVILFPLADLIWWVAREALPTFTWATVSQPQVGLGGGLNQMITGTLVIIGLSTVIAALIGVPAGMYTAEFASPRVAELGRLAGYLLAGIPAVVLGFFGLLLLATYAGWGYSLGAGTITLAIFMVPFIYRTSDQAFSSVPREHREGALAMGATRGQYLRRVAFPIALPTMLTGIFLAMAIGMGETAPLLFTMGEVNSAPSSFFQPIAFLTGAIWQFYDAPVGEGTLHILAFQAAFILLVMVITLNVIIQIVAEHYRKRLQGLY